MKYEYRCTVCGTLQDHDFKIGQAAKTVKCQDCGHEARRAFTSMSFSMEGPSSNLRFNREQRAKNERAGDRMLKTWGKPMSLVDQT